MRASVLGLLREPPLLPLPATWDLSIRRWVRLLRWLDTSGLALYFLRRLEELGLEGTVPAKVLERLHVNLRDNTERFIRLADEAAAIRVAFEQGELVYAVSKGFSLWPDSVPQMELRSQLDLDFLIAEVDATKACHVLEARGYVLCAISGRTWEFKTPAREEKSLIDLYKPSEQFCVELHLQSDSRPNPLNQRQRHVHRGVSMPVLSASDIFLGQAHHLFKHLSRDSIRTSHILEFYRHVLARETDLLFWQAIREQVRLDPGSRLAVGASLLLIAQQFDQTFCKVVPLLEHFPVPAGIRLWLTRYGTHTTYCDFPGSKLYLLLQTEIRKYSSTVQLQPSGRATLIPRRLPPRITVAPKGEFAAARLRRQLKQLWYISFRARFHLIAGLQYALERRAWQRALKCQGDLASPTDERSKPGSLRQQVHDNSLTGL